MRQRGNAGFCLSSRGTRIQTSLAAGFILLLSLPSLAFPADVLNSKADATLKVLLQQAESPESRQSAPGLETSESRRPIVDYQDVTLESVVFLIVEGDVDRSALTALGVEVNTEAGPFRTIQAPLSAVTEIMQLPGVERVSAAAPVYPMLDVSASEIAADDMWGASAPFFGGTTGRNVVVGVVDTGLDLTHGDFKNSTGWTRVKYAWDQTWTGTKPIGFNYGAEYTEAMINAGQATSFRDNDGHGTHVTGIAAGNGRATGNGQPDYKYVGIAPEADLVIVKTNFTDAGVIDGVNYIFQKAAALGKPAVVNLSVGSQKGGHDGSHSMDQAISALTGSGKLVTAAAGNYGNVGIHKRIAVNTGATFTVPIILPAYTPTTVAPENLVIEGWHDSPSAVFKVKLRSPSGYESAWISPGASSGYVTVGDGSYIVDNGLITNSRGARLISINIYRASTTTPHPTAGTWSLYVNRTGGWSGVCDFWVSSWKLSTTVSPTFGSPDFAMSITSPASGDKVIATGAYSTKSQWTNGSGGTTSYGTVPLNYIADFSSHGPRRDGVRKPDIVAPGYGIAAALSVNAPTSNTYKVLDQVHYMRIGTSQANAHTTGVLALLLQQNRYLAPDQARQDLTLRADVDSYTGAVPNDLYGSGKLDMAVNVSAVEQVKPEVFQFHPRSNPAVDRATFEFTLPSSGRAGETVRFRIFDLNGRVVADVEQPAGTGEHEWTWEGNNREGAEVADGVYFAQLQVGDRASRIKFVMLKD